MSTNFKKFPQNTQVTPDGDSVHDETADAIKVIAVGTTGTSGHLVPGTEATDLGKAEDGGHASGATGVMLLGVRNDTPTALSGTDLDYTPLATDSYGRAKLGQVVPGTAAADLGKAEDAAHTTGDTGVMALAVRKDTGTTLAGADGDYAPPQLDQYGGLRVGRPVFGEPSLTAVNNSSVNWAQGLMSPLDQKSPTGWLANLYGGVQTGDDWARVNIPVDELLLTKLTSAQWTYYLTQAQSMGVNIVVWVHDPTNFSKRAEITQVGGAAGLGKALGWNSHVLNTATVQFFFYGENVTGNTTCTTPGTQYTLAQFQSDALFSTWTIYRITIEYGWEASGTFLDAWVADISLNGIPILLKPDSGGTGRIARRYAEATTGAVSFTIAPKTPFRLLSMSVHASAALKTGEVLTITKDCGLGTDGWGDAVIFSDDLFIGTRLSLFVPFGEGYDFPAEDELDVTQANSEDKDLSIVAVYQTVFA